VIKAKRLLPLDKAFVNGVAEFANRAIYAAHDEVQTGVAERARSSASSSTALSGRGNVCKGSRRVFVGGVRRAQTASKCSARVGKQPHLAATDLRAGAVAYSRLSTDFLGVVKAKGRVHRETIEGWKPAPSSTVRGMG
jgi:hypothetical protein